MRCGKRLGMPEAGPRPSKRRTAVRKAIPFAKASRVSKRNQGPDSGQIHRANLLDEQSYLNRPGVSGDSVF